MAELATLLATVFNPEWKDFNPNHLVDSNITAIVVDVKYNTLTSWRCTGRNNLPYVKTGKRVRYKVGDILNFIDRRTRTQTKKLRSATWGEL